MGRAFNLLKEALVGLDENGEQEEALEQYKLAVEVCLTAQVVDCPLGQNSLACICVRPTICGDTLVVHCIR